MVGNVGILLEAADGAAVGGTSSILSLLLMAAVWIGVLWFFMMRPQSKEKKRMAAMLATLEAGDSVQTTSGFFGTVIDIVDDDTVIVEFGNNKNCRIPMEKNAICKIEKPGE